MIRTKNFILLLLVWFVIGITLSAKNNILIIHSYSQKHVWTSGITEGMLKEFEENAEDPEFFIEYMDTKRFATSEIFPIKYKLFKKKYSLIKPDIIVVSDNNAFDFILQYRDSLFTNIPVVFTGINFFEDSLIVGQRNITGISELLDIKGTYQLAFSVFPYTNNVVIVNDRTTTGLSNKDEIFSCMKDIPEGVNVNYIDSIAMPDLQNYLSKLSKQSLVFLFTFHKDANNKNFTTKEFVRQISDSSPVPVFSVWDQYLNGGIIGGKVISRMEYGKRTAQMAIKILEGTNPEDIPIYKGTITHNVIDFSILKNYKHNYSALKNDILIINKPESPLFKYRRILYYSGIIIFSLLIISVLLYTNLQSKKKSESEIKDGKRSLDLALKGASLGLWEIDFRNSIVKIYDKWSNICPNSKEITTFTFDEWQKAINVHDFELFEKQLSDHALGFIEHIDLRFRFVTKTNKPIWVEFYGRITKLDDNDSPQKASGVIKDITDVVEQEKMLEMLSNITQQINDSIVISDKNFKITYINSAGEKLFGYKLEELQGKSPAIFNAETDYDKTRKQIVKNISNKKAYSSVQLNKTKSGKLFFCEFKVMPLLDDKNQIISYFAIQRDVTERIEYEKNLKILKEAAEKSDKLKSEFLAQISHEIRTPLNVILSFTSMLKEEIKDMLTNDLDTIFDSIDRSAQRIIRTVDLILNMSQIQTKSYDPNFEFIDLNSILEDLYIEMSQIAKKNNLEFYYTNLAPNTTILADEFSVFQIFANLINNAIKYTPDGKVEIILTTDKDKIIVKIVDTGVGISEEFIPDLFLPFSQEEQGYTRKYDGTGLGLTLVKSYCELNNAEIKVDSDKGIGSTFSIIFDIKTMELV